MLHLRKREGVWFPQKADREGKAKREFDESSTRRRSEY
jgi:hypothetical protein